MENGKVTSTVCLDTDIIDRLGRNFESPPLASLKKLCIAGDIKLVMTEVNCREINRHLAEEAKAIYEELHKAKNTVRHKSARYPSLGSSDFLEPNLETLINEAKKPFNDFLSNCKATIIELMPSTLPAVMDLYFLNKPPFGKGEKKQEFPDAFSLLSLQEWASAHKQSLYVISHDKDLSDFCNGHTHLLHCGSLEDFLDAHVATEAATKALKAALSDDNNNITGKISTAFEKLDFTWDEFEDGEVLTVSVNSVELTNKIKILELKENEALFEVDCTIAFEAEVEYEDFDSAFYDSEERQAYAWRNKQEFIQIEESFKATISAKFEQNFAKIILEVDAINDGNSVGVSKPLDYN